MPMTTQVAIIGAGPAGMLLSEILHRHGVDSVVVERQTRDYVLSRIRAGVLEQTTVDVLRANGLSERLDREGHAHDGMQIVWSGRSGFFIDVQKHQGKRFVAYGQTSLQEDLFAAAERRGARVLHGAQDVALHGIDGTRPSLSFMLGSTRQTLTCDFIAGCDGFHGVSRRAMPAGVLREFEKVYPFGWLGVLSATPPLPDIV